MALRQKVYGFNTPFLVHFLAVHGVDDYHPKSQKPLRPNQKLATSEDFS